MYKTMMKTNGGSVNTFFSGSRVFEGFLYFPEATG
jgi:hypothetical protein